MIRELESYESQQKTQKTKATMDMLNMMNGYYKDLKKEVGIEDSNAYKSTKLIPTIVSNSMMPKLMVDMFGLR